MAQRRVKRRYGRFLAALRNHARALQGAAARGDGGEYAGLVRLQVAPRPAQARTGTAQRGEDDLPITLQLRRHEGQRRTFVMAHDVGRSSTVTVVEAIQDCE